MGLISKRRALFIAGLILGMVFGAARGQIPTDMGVEIGEPFVISKSDETRYWFPWLFQWDADTLIVSIQRSADAITPDFSPKPVFTVSKDGGRTWSEPQPQKELCYSWLRLKNGSCLWLGYYLWYQTESVARFDVGRSQDGVNYTITEGIVDISPHKFKQIENGAASIQVHRWVMEKPDGTLLASMYGRFVGDTLDRCIMVSSVDGGTTWKYFSTIGYDPAVGNEGFNEPSVVRLADGELFCFLRNGPNKPMYSTRSSDGGKTWSAPQRMPEEYAQFSVDPDLLLLSNGVLACSGGRTDCRIMFSLDGTGKTWTRPTTVFSGPTTSYTSIREVAPNRLFYLYDVVPAWWEMPKKGEPHEIRGVFLTLIPKVSDAPDAASSLSVFKDDLTVQPKVRPAMMPLPIGQVRPTGWLLDWAQAARNGITGHLDERSPTFSEAWKGISFEAPGVEANGTGWPLEQCSYWLDGLVRLAYILDDQYLINKAKSRLDLVVDGVLKGGESLIYWLPNSVLDPGVNYGFNSWAHSHMGRALVAYYQATGNPRILEALQRAYRDYPLPDIAPGIFSGVSGAVNVDPMLETYMMSGDERILKNAMDFASRKPFDDLVDRWAKGDVPQGHTVIYYENARVPALLYLWTGDERMLRATRQILEQNDRNHGLPMGVASGEEYLAGIGSTRHIEACDIPAAEWTFDWLLRITGDRQYADRIEQIFFNAAPAPIYQNFDEMSYFQAPNRVGSILPGEIAFGGGYTFSGLGGGAYCCVGNLNRILPNYVMFMWMATPDHGLAATLYGPCRVKTTVGKNIPVAIDCQTAYPFEETVRITVQPNISVSFPLYLRIPAWCKEPGVKVNDEPINVQPGQNGFVKLDRLWNPGDRIVLELPMAVRVEQGRETPFPQIDYFNRETPYKRNSAQLTDVNNPYACVYYGPLLFALPLPEKDANHQVEGIPFNYALETDPEKIKVSRQTMPKPWKWHWDTAPIQLRVPARQFDWKPTAVQPLPKEPIEGGTPADIVLVPYGGAPFHISMFPVAKPSADAAPSQSKKSDESIQRLENNHLSLDIDEKTGVISRLENKLTGEIYAVSGDEFSIKTTDGSMDFSDAKLIGLTRQGDEITVRFDHPKLAVEVVYSLGSDRHFIEKKVRMTFKEACGLTRIVAAQPRFLADGLTTACYRYPDFDIVAAMVKARHGWDFSRPPDSEPARTFFSRSPKGGFFVGLEMPYDLSTLKENTVSLCYAPNLKIKAGEKFVGETMYLGVYRRDAKDAVANNVRTSIEALWVGKKGLGGFDGAAAAGLKSEKTVNSTSAPVGPSKIVPLVSESEAMAAMASAILGPPRHGLKAFACGGHCQMLFEEYDTDEKFQSDVKSLEFFKQCGLDGLMESHPWGGEVVKMNALREGDHYEMSDRNRRFLNRAGELGLAVMQFSAVSTNPWSKRGGPFRLDNPQWLRVVKGRPSLMEDTGDFRQQFANCMGCRDYSDWLEQLVADTLATDFYRSWCIDGDFWGTGAYFHTTFPVECFSDYHDHLAVDSNYACQKAMERLAARVRQLHPDYYLNALRPVMDLGVWALRDYDACFTLIESGTGESNLAGGDEIRTASRIRVHHHFFPHWLDQAFVFPSYGDPTLKKVPPWPSKKIDYILLSAISSTPNLFMSLPSKTGIPDADKLEIRKWLDWGRKNAEFLMVRKDLTDWPEKGKVDGSAHIIDDHGLVFLFNPSQTTLAGEFQLTQECIGLKRNGIFQISQEYPTSPQQQKIQYGQAVRWDVPPETVVILAVTQGS